MICPICATVEMRRDGEYAHCRACDYWASDLAHDVQNTSAPDEEYELVSYEHTRRANYLAILELLASVIHPAAACSRSVAPDGLFLSWPASTTATRRSGSSRT